MSGYCQSLIEALESMLATPPGQRLNCAKFGIPLSELLNMKPEDYPGPRDYSGTCNACGNTYVGSKLDVKMSTCRVCAGSKPAPKEEVIELLPCPFCGGEPALVNDNRCYGHGDYRTETFLQCKKCFSRGPNALHAGDASGAAAKWNKQIKLVLKPDLEQVVPKCLTWGLEVNPHKGSYDSVADYIQYNELDESDFIAGDQGIYTAKETDTIYRFQWFPRTMVGSYTLYAASMRNLIDHLYENDKYISTLK